MGGKTAIDTRQGKNLIGAFHPPRAVIADADLPYLTLPDRELACGFAEILKHGLLADAAYFEAMPSGRSRAIMSARPRRAVGRIVAGSVEIKADVVSRDEREGGVRALLNLGHTFGHAFEAQAGAGEALKHGEAVALGCVLALRYSEAEGLCPPGAADRAASVFKAAGLPTRLSDLPPEAVASADRLAAHMAHDKKASGGALTLVLCEGIGRAVTRKGVPAEAVAAFLRTQGAM